MKSARLSGADGNRTDCSQSATMDTTGFDFKAANGIGYLPITFGTINQTMIRVVDGHAPQAFLGSTIDFQVWFMGAVSGAKLERGRDYERAGPPRVNKQTVRSGVQVVFSISAAKNIAMMAAGDRGRAIRRYFIEQANRLSNGEPPLPFFAELQQ